MPEDARASTEVIYAADVSLSVRDIAHLAHVSTSSAHRTVTAPVQGPSVELK
jgi:hypothetical protein